ncbi:trimethylamine methyltransferase family protein [Candidatus Formimonas warabiya]|nr:trimethylamine methyltransferase family protein [Candidatus Formimonas warabiya]
MNMNHNYCDSIKTTFLTDEKKKAIHEATLDLLENCGVTMESKQAKELLYSFGAQVTSQDIVKIPCHLVERALNSTMPKIVIYDRDGNPAMEVGGTNLYFGSNSEDLEMMEPFTGKTRKFLIQDRLLLTRVIDALPNMDFAMCGGIAADENPAIADRTSFTGTAVFTKKPLVFSAAEGLDTCKEIIQAAEIIAGGEKELSDKPFIMNLSDPLSPLRNTNRSLNNLITCAEKKIPVIYMPYLLVGGTAPVTMMGALIQSNAEVLSGLVVSQLMREGTPFIYGSMPAPFDMRTTIGTFGSPEFHIMVAAAADMAQYYRLPFFGTAGTTDAFVVDEQAVMEATMSVMMTCLSKANLAHDVGLMYHCNIISPYLIVLCNEIINMVRPMRRGIKMDEEQMALGLITKVGPGGQYITEEHTFKFFRDFWYPELLDRSMFGGGKSLKDKINDKLKTIIESHELPVLGDDKLKELKKLENRWRS